MKDGTPRRHLGERGPRRRQDVQSARRLRRALTRGTRVLKSPRPDADFPLRDPACSMHDRGSDGMSRGGRMEPAAGTSGCRRTENPRVLRDRTAGRVATAVWTARSSSTTPASWRTTPSSPPSPTTDVPSPASLMTVFDQFVLDDTGCRRQPSCSKPRARSACCWRGSSKIRRAAATTSAGMPTWARRSSAAPRSASGPRGRRPCSTRCRPISSRGAAAMPASAVSCATKPYLLPTA